MADEAARIAQLEAELAAARQREATLAAENARLTSERQQAFRHQAATADVLRAIAASPTQIQPVLDALVQNARRVGNSAGAVLNIREGDVCRALAVSADGGVLGPTRVGNIMPLSLRAPGPRALLERRTIHLPDRSDPAVVAEFPDLIYASALASITVPLIHEDRAIGYLTMTREVAERYSPSEIRLVETFADTAAIAIAHARIFQELDHRNGELGVALERQTATAEVLRVIAAAPTDLPRVLSAICAMAGRLSRATTATIQTPRGSLIESVAFYGLLPARGGSPTPEEEEQAARKRGAWSGTPLTRWSFSGRAFLDRETIHVVDVEQAVEHEFPASRAGFLRFRQRVQLCVPLRRGDAALGVLTLHRHEPRPFSEQEIALLEAFADQAVIAIENARLFEELQEANLQLAEASQHKSQFLASMSHELRTPLNAIIGYSEMLQEEAEDLDQETLIPDLQKVNAAGKHLLGLINDILDLSKIEAGRMDLFLETFEVGPLVQDVAAIVRPLIEKNGNVLIVTCPDDIGTMQADLTKVRQALFNLLSNAAKFTDHGTISLAVDRESPTPQPPPHCNGEGAGGWGYLTFSVTDTGIGMTEEQLGRLFEAFSQAEANTRSKYGGTGLGLAISRSFCRLMGGDLTVDSVYGQGSTFTVHLPTMVTQPSAAN